MVVIKKPGTHNENEKTEPKVDRAERVSNTNLHDNEGTVSEGAVVEKETTIDDQTNEKQSSSELEPVGSRIKGWEKALAAKRSPRTVRTIKTNSKSWFVHEAIANYAKRPDREFLTIEINETLRSKYGLTDSVINSYYYSKKQSGYLDSRELTTEESIDMKRPIVVWWTTELFWDVYEATKERIANEQAKQSSILVPVVEESASTDDESE